MATFTAARAATAFPAYAGKTGAGALQVAFGTIEVAADPADGDIYEMCKLPAGSTVVGGWLYGDDIDTGTEAVDIDIGWAANGEEAADPDGFGKLGVWTGDAVTGIKPEVGNYFPLGGVLLNGDLQQFTAETTIQLEANAAAGTFTAGAVSIVVLYVVA